MEKYLKLTSIKRKSSEPEEGQGPAAKQVCNGGFSCYLLRFKDQKMLSAHLCQGSTYSLFVVIRLQSLPQRGNMPLQPLIQCHKVLFVH